jgi:anti-sigma factor RsiW
MCDYGDRQEHLLGYLYDELPAPARQVFEAHLSACAECRTELAGFETTRGHLAAWVVPDARAASPGLRLVAPVAPSPRRRLPAWGLAAAAMLVLGLSAALANLEIRVGTDSLTLRTGWAQAGQPDPIVPSGTTLAADAPAGPLPVSLDEWQAALAALQARLDDLEAGAARPAGGPVQLASGPRMSDAELLRRVRDIVTQSEDRQERAIMARLSQVLLEFERQRRTDLALIQQGMNQYHGFTNAEIAQQRETINQLVRVRQEK